MNLSSESFRDERAIPGRLAFCVPDPKTRARLSDNRNPQLAWSDLPSGTRSLMLVCHDYDVPSKPDDVNKEGRSIPASLPRISKKREGDVNQQCRFLRPRCAPA